METRTFPCPTCGSNVVAEVPSYDIVNREKVSMFLMVHQDTLTCPNCNQAFQFSITGVKGLQYGWRPITPPDEDEHGVIVPPKNLTVKSEKTTFNG
jgi:hypothetical protein